jgi:sialate O-acetylesterase
MIALPLNGLEEGLDMIFLLSRAFARFSFVCFMAMASAHGEPRFNKVFTDHAVIQRDRAIDLWGTALPAERIEVSLSDKSVKIVTDKAGTWRVRLPLMKAGGPYILSVTNQNGEKQQLNDVLIGDVFLCSGQSNMDMQIKASMNAEAEIRRTNHPLIRMYTVPRASSARPLTELKSAGSWKIATPQNAGDFSAACFYFARELQPHVDVPIGLINAAWGGSTIEAWIGADAMAALGRAKEIALLNTYAQDEKAAQMQFGNDWEAWWTRSLADAGQPWSDESITGWSPVPLPLRDWKKWGDADLAQLNGMVWYRKSFDLAAVQAKNAAILHLGAIDEIDMTWVNGKPLAHSFGWGENRDYALPANMLRAGRNHVVTNIFSSWDLGGMLGPAKAIRLEMKDKSSIALGDGWMFKKAPKGGGEPPRAPWLAIGGMANIGNAMIAPLAPYGLRGALWYQGESNTKEAKSYQSLLTALMGDWRTKFNNPQLPFMIVQLPNFGLPVVAPTASDWSDLREAQRQAVLDDEAAGLAVTIDVGENDDIHPPNKQIVGQRLARLARNLVYKQALTPNGPVPRSAIRRDKGIVIKFSGFDGSLIAHSGSSPMAFEICGADQSSCRFADAEIEGDGIVLHSAAPENVQRIRYCWGDAPICNLYDAAGLPAGPFEIAVR